MPILPTVSNFSPRAARKIAVAILLAAPGIALAHPNHGASFFSALLHPFMGWDHLLAAVAVGVWSARLGMRSAWLMPAIFVAAMLAGIALGAAGFSVPLTEIGIALSVAVLGILITLDARLGPMLGGSMIAAFALCHGSAHGTEVVPLAATYALGIALGTLLLHTAGVAAALALKARPLTLRLAAAPIAIAGFALLALRLQ